MGVIPSNQRVAKRQRAGHETSPGDLSNGANIVIVSTHSFSTSRTRETALAMGAHAFVGKADLMELRELIKENVGSHLTAAEK